MKSILLTSISGLLLLLISFSGRAGTDNSAVIRQVEKVLELYIKGTQNYSKEALEQAILPEGEFFLSTEDQPVWKVTGKEYVNWYKDKPINHSASRLTHIKSIKVKGESASASLEVFFTEKNKVLLDSVLLKKVAGSWKIVAKTAVPIERFRNGQRILFIVSDANFHRGTKLKAGVSFSELVYAWDTFVKAGFWIDVISPGGGATPLSYINTSDPLHKEYLYNPDFMFAFNNTKTASQVEPANYQAVHYIGGSNAMYGVPEDASIQRLVMAIYELHGGIISSVCHGTAGIVHLKKSNGDYLVKGKRITGYPESFEKQHADYFKAFPFLMQKTIEQRGGEFLVGDKDKGFIQVDDRLITGQNYLSSKAVAEAVIGQLKR